MKNKNMNLKGLSLAEVLVTIVIIGVLLFLTIPNFTSTITKAKETEAKLQLKQVYSMQQFYFNMNSKYSSSLEDIDFVQEKLKSDGGKANYRIEIVEASSNSFKARATAVVDFDQDGVFNVWEIDQEQNIKRTVKD